jgi:hypothetical protein
MNQIVNVNRENQTHLGPVCQSQEADTDTRLQLMVCQMLVEVTNKPKLMIKDRGKPTSYLDMTWGTLRSLGNCMRWISSD